MKKGKKISIYLDDDNIDLITSKSEQTGQSLSKVVNALIKQSQRHPKPNIQVSTKCCATCVHAKDNTRLCGYCMDYCYWEEKK